MTDAGRAARERDRLQAVVRTGQERERIELVRRTQRSALSLTALNRVNKEIYPEIHELRFKLASL